MIYTDSILVSSNTSGIYAVRFMEQCNWYSIYHGSMNNCVALSWWSMLINISCLCYMPLSR